MVSDSEGLAFRVGFYRHYKVGRPYFAIGLARHSETGEVMVLYMPLYVRADNVKENVQMCVRPLKMFLENVTTGAGSVPRFEYMGGSQT